MAKSVSPSCVDIKGAAAVVKKPEPKPAVVKEEEKELPRAMSQRVGADSPKANNFNFEFKNNLHIPKDSSRKNRFHSKN